MMTKAIKQVIATRVFWAVGIIMMINKYDD